MANALPSLEDHLTCAICFEVYNNPQMLKCLHTFCAEPCLKQLARKDVIVCPDCRKPTRVHELKKDFRAESLIDLHNQQQRQSQTSKDVTKECKQQLQFTCEMCDNIHKEVKFRCIDCELYICNDCHVGHAKIKSCENHTIETIEGAKGILESHIKPKLLQLKEHKNGIENRIVEETKSLALVTQAEDQQIREVNDYIDEIVISINQHRADLHKTIKTANENTRQKLQENLEKYETYKGDIDSRTEYLTELMQTSAGDISTTISLVKEIDPEEHYGQVQDLIYNIDALSPSPVSIKKNHSSTWIKTAIDVLVIEQTTHNATQPELSACYKDIEEKLNRLRSDPPHQEEERQPQQDSKQPQETMSHPSFQSLISASFSSPIKASVSDRPYALITVNSTLWCCIGNQIVIFSKQFEKKSTIEHSSLVNMKHMTQCKMGDVVVACDDGGGLHRLDSKGAYIGQIVTGSYSSVYSFRKKIAAFSYNYGIIHMIKCKGGAPFEVIKTIKLQDYENGHHLDKLVVVDGDHFWIGSFTAANLYQYNSDGERTKQLGIKGYSSSAGTFKKMILCGIDADNNILVSDYLNQRLQVYINASEEWRILDSLEFGGWPLFSFVTIHHQWIYVTTWNKQLLKFKINH